MKKVIFLLFFFHSFIGLGQKLSWTTYFPVRSNVIGHTFIGTNPMDSKIQEDIENVTIKTEAGASTFTKEQQRISEFALNALFKKHKLGVSNIQAYGVKLDNITKATLDEMPRNIPFVYAGLRADSSTITFKKAKKAKIDSGPIIETLKNVYPSIPTTELGGFIDFLKFTSETNDSSDFKITVKDPTVYFLVQIAQIDKTNDKKWEKYCASFLSLAKHYVTSFTLVDSLNFYKTGIAETHFASQSAGQKAKVWLEIDKAGNLMVHSQISAREPEKIKMLTERNGTWTYDNIVVRSYPYRTGQNSEIYKDILLIINARREGKKIIIESGANTQICGATYLNYPESKFRWIDFKIN